MKNTKEKNIGQVVWIVSAVPELDGSVVLLGFSVLLLGFSVLGPSLVMPCSVVGPVLVFQYAKL